MVMFPGKMSAEDTIVVTGNVAAKGADFQLELTADKTGNLSEGDEVTYRINYGSYLSTTIRNLVISAVWSRGTVAGSPIPSVDIVDYVVGSGTTAWGEAEPVIDLVNRSITWTVSFFPANTADQTVEFKLAVNNSYTGSSDVTFTVESDLGRGHSLLMSSSVDNVYHPAGSELSPTPEPTLTEIPTPTPSTGSGLTASPTPRSGPTSTPGPVPTAITTTGSLVTPTPTVVVPKIEKVEIVALSNNGISVESSINVVPQLVKIVYGDTLTNMADSLVSINGLKTDVLNIDGLKPETVYYFRILVTDNDGNMARSDIFTFKTAAVSDKPEIDTKSIVISSMDNVLLDTKTGNSGANTVAITINQSYALRVNLTKPEAVKLIKVMMVNSQILGINTVYGAEPNSVEENLTDSGNGSFVAHLVTPAAEGFYDIVVRMEDLYGNISQNKIGGLRVIAPLTVVDESGQSIENAKVVFYRLNPELKTYELISRGMFGIQNPSYSEPDGRVAANFPNGGYRVEVSQMGYENRVENFTIGLGENEKMPKVVLKKYKMGVAEIIAFYSGISKDTFNFSKVFLYNLTISSRFFKLTALAVTVNGIVLLWLFTANYYVISWWLVPGKIISKVKNRLSKKPKNILKGTVSNADTKMPLNGVKVYLVDEKFNKVISKSITNKLGEFHLLIKPSKGYRLAAVKEGFEPTPMLDFTSEGIIAGRVDLKMEETVTAREIIETELGNSVGRIIAWLWSVWMVWLVVMEVIFLRSFGLGRNWWGLAISLLSLGWWLSVILKKHELEKN